MWYLICLSVLTVFAFGCIGYFVGRDDVEDRADEIDDLPGNW